MSSDAARATRVRLDAIEIDTSIQCRATIDTGVVNDYAERMGEGDEFPAIRLFGTKAKAWIGDGWHRVFAARQQGAKDIAAIVTVGGRVEALKHALGANAQHGNRRTNADKRRAVEIALREFPKLSSRAVAELCGVSNHMVDDQRPKALGESPNATRTTSDGRQYPATREAPAPLALDVDRPAPDYDRPSGVASENPAPPSNGMEFARMAVMDLEKIRPEDVERAQAFAFVKEWIDAR
jgi:hypothetical protein